MTWAERRRSHWINKNFPQGGTQDDVADAKSNINLQDSLKKDYSGRVLLELLQNMDDAANQAALNGIKQEEWRAEFIVNKDTIEILNQGIPFDENAMTSICTGHLSTKENDTNTTGAKGVGFRGILNWSNDIRIYSGNFAVRFSSECLNDVLKELEAKDNPVYKELKSQPDKLNNISPLFVPFDIDETCIPQKWHNGKYDGVYDTCIELKLNTEHLTLVKAAIQNFIVNEIQSMLFLRRITKIIFVDNTDSQSKTTIVTVSSFSHNKKSISTETPDASTTEEFFIFNLNNTDTIAVPCSWDKKRAYPLYNSFPISKEILPLPVLINSYRFNLTQNRDMLSNDAVNETVLSEILVHLLEIGEYFFTQKSSNKNWAIELFNVKRDLALNMEIWNSAIKRCQLLTKLKYKKIIPSIDGKHWFSFNDAPEYVDIKENSPEVLTKILASQYIDNSTNEAIEASLLGMRLKELSDKNLCSIINKYSEQWTTNQRIDVLKFWLNTYRYSDVLPKLLKTQHNKFFELSGNNRLFLYSGDTIGNIPEWSVDIISKEDRDCLFNNTPEEAIEKKKERILTRQHDKIFNYTDKNQLIESINTFINNNFNRSIEFLRYIYDVYDKTSSSSYPKFNKLYFPGKDGMVYEAENLYFDDSYYKEDSLSPKICKAAGYKALATPQQLGLQPETIEHFKDVIGELSGIKKEIKPEIKVVASFEPEYSDILKECIGRDRTYYIKQAELQTIDKLRNILLNDEIEQNTLIKWLQNVLHKVYKEGSVRQIDYFWLRSKTHTEHDISAPNYIIWQILNTPWLTVNGIKTCPKDCIIQDKIWPEFIPQTPGNFELWKELGIKVNVAELPTNTFYDILLKLPEYDKTGSISKRIYNFIAASTNKNKIPALLSSNDNPNRLRFISNGKLWAKQKKTNKETFFPVSEIRFHSGKPINIKNYPILVTPPKSGSSSVFYKLFGVETLTEKFTASPDKFHHSNNSFEKKFQNFKKYLRCFDITALNDVLLRLTIKIVSQATIVETNSLWSADDYNIIQGKGDNLYLIYLRNSENINEKKISQDIADICSQKAASELDASLIELLWRDPDTERKDRLIAAGYNTDELDFFFDIKTLFTNRIKEINNGAKDYKEIISCINFDDFENNENAKYIINILQDLKVDVNEFNTKDLQINLCNYNKLLVINYANSVAEIFYKLKYEEIINSFNESLESKYYKNIVLELQSIRDFPASTFANSIKFDAKEWFKNWFKLSDSFMNTLNTSTKPDVTIDELYEQKLSEFKNIIGSYDKEILTETLNNLNNKGLLLFGNFDSLKNKYNEMMQESMKQPDSVVSPTGYELTAKNYLSITAIDVKARTSINEKKPDRHMPKFYSNKTEQKKQRNGENAEKLVYDKLCKKYGKSNVHWVSKTAQKYNSQSSTDSIYGDSAGYDISYKVNNDEKFVEVKNATILNKDEYSFSISRNEENCAREKKDSYSIYLVLPDGYIELSGQILFAAIENGRSESKNCAIKINNDLTIS